MHSLDFKLKHDKNDQIYIETSLSGKPLLMTPQLNKGSAFSAAERRDFDLLGKLPFRIETIEEQCQRIREQLQSFDSDFQRHIFLNGLHDTNQVLFYKFVSENLTELMPLIYTPHIGVAVKSFSEQFRRPRGLFIAYPERKHIRAILDNRSNPEIDLIVVTDGSAVLGIGDQGVGSINIPIGKLMVYSLCGGINPTRTLPIMLDVGTNNERLLADPTYLGWRHARLSAAEYDDFVHEFVDIVAEKFPHVMLHWEDFSMPNSRLNLAYCDNKVCAFNDDIQGTGAAALATMLAVAKATQTSLKDQRVVIFGAGTAGMGIADQVHTAMVRDGLKEAEAYQRFCLVDRPGLITTENAFLPVQQNFARDPKQVNDWPRNRDGIIGLQQVIAQAKPTLLIGTSAVAGAFNEDCIKTMAQHTPRPIIMPLSNPTANAEATPQDLFNWTAGKALVATGSPFAPVEFNGQTIPIAQCNNSFIFPGLGLGTISAKAQKLSPDMIWAACDALSQTAPILHDPNGALLPSLADARAISRKIAIAVAKQAHASGLARIASKDITQLIDKNIWEPKYYPLQKKK